MGQRLLNNLPREAVSLIAFASELQERMGAAASGFWGWRGLEKSLGGSINIAR
jgi:hypothetical protein